MPTLEAEWVDSNLNALVPTTITDIVDTVVQPILDFVDATAAAAKIAAEAAKLTSDIIIPPIDPILTGISATLETIDALINDLVNTGAGLITIPPQLGGLNGFGNALRVGLVNSRLQNRPTISESGFVAGFGGIAYAPDLITARTYYNDITGAVAADDFVGLKLGLTQFKRSATFQAHDLKFKLARSASPQPDVPWSNVNLGQFIPRSTTLVGNVSAYLKGINTQIRLNPLDGFIAATNQVADSVQAVADDLRKTVDFIENAFPELPIKLWTVAPQLGGTQSVAESTKVWLDKSQYTILADVPNNAFVTGFFVLIGGAALADVQANFNIWDDLILP